MFKYLWILILAIAFLIFMAYMAYAVRAFSVKHKDEFNDFGEALRAFDDEHEALLRVWGAIIIGALFVLFTASVIAYSNSID